MTMRKKIIISFILMALVGWALGAVGLIANLRLLGISAGLPPEAAAEIAASGGFFTWLIAGLIAASVLIFVAVAVVIIHIVMEKIRWYENILDCIPFPLSVTDMNRNWTFINKPVEGMLNLKRSDVMGKPCSNWGAGICNTNNCGINCVERGQCTTNFEQGGMDFKVDISYLTNNRGKKVGHVEVVQDISAMVSTQKAEATLVKNIGQLSESFVTGSGQIASGAQALAQGSTQQAAAIEELSSSIAEIHDKTQRNAEMASKAAALANSIKSNAEKGSQQMSDMMAATKEINDAGQSIGKVIKSIDDIAFQTNILALNAAVEAARAGEHGKGFAVVADEVRNLAAKSAAAAKDTESLIANSIDKSELGVRIAEETAASLADIVTGINESNQLITEIANESEAQSLGISQINTGIGQVAQVVQQNSATAEESAAASQEMGSQANALEDLIVQFHRRYDNAVPSALPPSRS